MIESTKESSSKSKSELIKDEQWKELRGKLKKRWGKLNHLEIESLRDNLGLLSTQLEKRYGFSDEFAKHESETFMKKLKNERIERQIERDYPNIDEMQDSPFSQGSYG